ncbi:MAG: XdhC family protein [Tahibacter sp.]
MSVQGEFVTNGKASPHGARAVIDALAKNSNAVLGIVAETQGSTYRKVGALLLREADSPQGFLSGGCLEPELDEAARATHLSRQARWWAFNTRSDDDLLFGSASGCRGLVRLLLLPVPSEHPLRAALASLLDSRDPLQLGLHVDGGGRALANGQRWAWPGNPACAASEHAPAQAVEIQIAAPPHVLLAGCGPEAAILIGHLRGLGARISVIEHRGRWAAHAAGADIHYPSAPERVWSQLPADCYVAALVMGHHYGNDLLHLRRLADSAIPYVGLLGPPARRDALLADLGSAAEMLAGRLHAPVGLPLGGEGPEAIALSIAAQLQQHFSGKCS